MSGIRCAKLAIASVHCWYKLIDIFDIALYSDSHSEPLSILSRLLGNVQLHLYRRDQGGRRLQTRARSRTPTVTNFSRVDSE